MCTAEVVPEHDRWLGARERVVLATLRFPKRRSDWRLGRWTAHRACGDRVDEVLAADDGAPEGWRGGHRADLVLSISHSAGVGLCAVGPSGCLLGCDLERIEPRSPAFIRDYFTESEAAWVRDHTSPALAANLLWSAKESALKALRHGLRVDTRRAIVRVEPGDGERWSALRVAVQGHDLHGWWRRREAHVLTLVSDLAFPCERVDR